MVSPSVSYKPSDDLIDKRDLSLDASVNKALISEILTKRTEFSKTFDLGNGQHHISHRLAPIHYADNEGSLQDIDLTLQPDLTVAAAPFKISVLADGIGYRHWSRETPGAWAQMELVSIDDKPFEIPASEVRGNEVWWDNVASDVSIYFHVSSVRGEMYKVMSKPHTLVWSVTQSPDFDGEFDSNTQGKDSDSNPLELITSYEKGVYIETWTGRSSRITDKKTRIKSWQDTTALPVLIDSAFNAHITNGIDDVGDWDYLNRFYTNRTRIFVYSGGFPYHGGLRFRSIAVPNGATISAATLTVNVLTALLSPSVKFYGDKVDNAAVWSSSDKPKNITKTTASTTFAATSGVKVVNVLGIVQEVLGRGGWASLNAIRFAMFATAGTMAIEALENAGTSEAQIDITYTAGGGATTRMLASLGVGI